MSQSDEDLLELGSSTQMPVASSEILTQHFIQSPSPASSAMICTTEEAVSSSYGASMPSTAATPSDLMEQIQAQARRNYALEQIQCITTLLEDLSFSIPETRLAIYSRPSDGGNIVQSSSIVHAEQLADGTDMLCVAQRPEDADYTIEIHFKSPPQHFNLTNIKCQIFYDTGSDNCVLVNRTESILYLIKLEPSSYSSGYVVPDGRYAIQPGLWGIAVALSDDVNECIVKFLLRERRHSISIIQRENGALIKQPALGVNSATDVTPQPANFIKDPRFSAIKVNENPLLDLQDGDVANIQAPLPTTTFRQEFPVYQLKRVRKISEKGYASVFSCRHSLVPGNLAVKVLQHESGRSLSDLVRCSELWKREKNFLEKLKHPNIVSLKAFDGRLLALHLELLPPSLAQGLNSPFGPHDASKIVKTMSSALQYLEAEGIVHNDIKPTNIAYSPGRGAVLFDFGIASLPNERKVGGSPWYIPPELRYDSRRHPAGDIWAFGIIMLYVLKKIQYPDYMMKSWAINQIRKPGSEAKRQMKAWLELVYRARDGLDEKSPIEYTTFLMLDENQHTRITAAGIQNVIDYIE
ncbi:serine threonine protein kinase [Trichoderma austrokoningii]